MDNANEYIEERMNGLYNNYNSILLENFKNKKKDVTKGEFRKSFINYLEFRYSDKNIRNEYKNAKTDEQKIAFAKKYAKDYDDWSKRKKELVRLVAIDLLSYGFDLAGLPAVAIVLYLLGWGGLIHLVVKELNVKDKNKKKK